MKKNIGELDWGIRFLVLLFLLWLAYKFSPWWYLLVAWEIFVLLTRWCPVYHWLKIDTLGKKRK